MMIDKQIIIDYENICENYSKEVGCYNTFDGSCIKEQCFTYRLLQLLKAKEQECKELRQYHNKCCEENAKKLEEWLEKYNQLSKDFYNDKYCNKENCSLLKAKEQEYEALQMSENEAGKIIAELKAENDTLRQFLLKEPLALQALQSAYSSYKKSVDVFYEMIKQYKQALTEIKEVAENSCCLQPTSICEEYENCKECSRTSDDETVKQILQKISECEVENERKENCN